MPTGSGSKKVIQPLAALSTRRTVLWYEPSTDSDRLRVQYAWAKDSRASRSQPLPRFSAEACMFGRWLQSAPAVGGAVSASCWWHAGEAMPGEAMPDQPLPAMPAVGGEEFAQPLAGGIRLVKPW